MDELDRLREERDRLEQRLARSELLLRQVEQAAGIGFWVWEIETGALTWSDRLLTICGYEPGTFTPSYERFLAIVHPDDRALVQEVGARCLREGKGHPYDHRIVRADGTVRWIEGRCEPVGEGGRWTRLVGIARDVTETREAGAALRKSEARFRRLVEASLFGIVIGDGSGRIIDGNDAFLKMLGFDRADIAAGSMRWDTLTPAQYREVDERVVLDVRTKGFCAPYEKEFIRKDGSRVPILMGIAALGTNERDVEGIGFVLDLTRLKQAEEAARRAEDQLRHAQKMEAIGRLAGGIAHDFNNLLTAISGYAELGLLKLDSRERVRSAFVEIKSGTDRAAALTRRLLAFGRKQVRLPEQALDLGEVVASMSDMLRRLLGEDVALETKLARDLWPVDADPGSIEQVVVNLALNARDAMPDGGSLAIETRNVDPEKVLLVVSDSGTGMDQATLARIFEPFFTTKPVGKGTGLGLSTVYGIVQQFGGTIAVDSAPGKGARFEVLFPRSRAAVARAGAVDSSEGPGGTETILLVEDEPAVRRLVKGLLAEKGYRVIEAADGPQALALADAHAGAIELMLTDVIMPGMNGRQLHEKLARARPATRVVYMSGHPDGVLLREGVLEPGTAYLPKPFTPSALLSELRRVLDARRS